MAFITPPSLALDDEGYLTGFLRLGPLNPRLVQLLTVNDHQAATSSSAYFASSGSSAIVTYMVPKYAFTPEFPFASQT